MSEEKITEKECNCGGECDCGTDADCNCNKEQCDCGTDPECGCNKEQCDDGSDTEIKNTETKKETNDLNKEQCDGSPDTESKNTESKKRGLFGEAKRLKECEKLLAQMEEKGNELLNSLQRERADFENYRRRNQTAASDAYANGKCDMIAEILPVLDNFERAMAGADEADPFAVGVAMIQRQLMEKLSAAGLSEIEAKDKPFDPVTMNAVMQDDAEGVEPDTVTEVLQTGYKVGERIIRHAMVKVAK